MNHPKGDGSTSDAPRILLAMEAATINERPQPGQTLLDWLRLLGWQVRVTRSETVEAVAERAAVRIHAEGSSLADVAWLLFERAVLAHEQDARRQAA